MELFGGSQSSPGSTVKLPQLPGRVLDVLDVVVAVPVVPVVDVAVIVTVVDVVDVPVIVTVVDVVEVAVIVTVVDVVLGAVPVVTVVVVTGVIVVVVVPPPKHVSQQLPGPPDVPPVAWHWVALDEMRQRDATTDEPGRFTQHVTKPGLPHVECAAHSVTSRLHSLGSGSVSLSTSSRAIRRTQRTYWPWLVAVAQGQFASARARVAATAAGSSQPLAAAGRTSAIQGTNNTMAKTHARAFIGDSFPGFSSGQSEGFATALDGRR